MRIWLPAALVAVQLVGGGCGGDAPPPTPAPAATPLFDMGELGPGLKKRLIRDEIRAFSGAEGHNPSSLGELGQYRNFKIPPPPPGMRWDYQPEVGSIEAVPK